MAKNRNIYTWINGRTKRRVIYYKDYHDSEYWFDKKGNKIHTKIIFDIDRNRLYLKFTIKSYNNKITDIDIISAECRYSDSNRSEFTMIKG